MQPPISALGATPATSRREGAYPWVPDGGDGTYFNPILHADYSDPDVIRVGEDYYLVASSFNCTPGLPILHSRDLVNWRLIGHAVKNLPDARYEQVQAGCGIWAPAWRYHHGRYWLFFPMPDEGIFLVTAEHPTGPWSEPHLVVSGKGLIDPCPLWDDDGQAYLVHAYAKSRSGLKHQLRVRPMAPDGSHLLGEGKIVFHDPERHPTLEGPKFLKRNGWYYLLAPAGGVETGWQVVLRSRHIYGPYEDRIVLSQGDTDINGPHQGALVDTPSGDWWFVHFQDAGVYGRITHLQPVRWEEDWPLMGCNGEPVRHFQMPVHRPEAIPLVPQTDDEFNDSRLGWQWQWNANHRDEWYSLTARPGWLRLYPQLEVTPHQAQPNLLLQKFPARSFTVETQFELVSLNNWIEAGLVVAGANSVMLGWQGNGTVQEIVLRQDDKLKILTSTTATRVRFQLQVRDGGWFTLAYATGDEFVALPMVFHASKGVWIGARVGLYALKHVASAPVGHADVDYFRFR